MDIESGISVKNTLKRHEEEIRKLNNEVFGCSCCKVFSFLGVCVLWIIVYLKAFGVL